MKNFASGLVGWRLHLEQASSWQPATVAETIRTLAPNRVLKEKPPDIHPSEKSLPRKVRCSLSRLRSGFCRLLQSYLHRLDETVSDDCPECGQAPHDTAHLFNCKSNPTTLTPLDLWRKPREAAAFLKLNEKEEI